MADIIDEITFSQLLEIDDYDFAKGIVDEYFQQAKDVIGRLESLLTERDWVEIGRVGHHLKGSSAAVGAAVVRDICDSIQHYDTASKNRDPSLFLRRKIDGLKAAIPIAEQALTERFAALAT